jgi:ABC-2 type transport system ATP-binding protein
MLPSGGPPIAVSGLRKSYGGVEAVRGVSFSVERGSIFGLIGPDGAGKTTILRTVVALLSFDSGEVLFCGQAVDKDPSYVRSRVGYMPQRFSLYQDLSVAENLRFFGDLFGVPRRLLGERLSRLYEFSGLSPFKSRRAGALSGGMKQKLALSCMLVHSPEVLVMDEPTFGVDPVSRGELWDILRALRDEGTAVLVSTAYMDEALLCDRVALVHEGRILAEESPGELAARYEEPLYLVQTAAAHRAHAELERSLLCGQCTLFGGGVHITLRPGVTTTQVEERLAGGGVEFQPLRRIVPGLEDLFLKLMK